MVEESEDAEDVVTGDWECEDAAEGVSGAVLAGDGEISCVSIDFGSYIFPFAEILIIIPKSCLV